MEKRGKDLNKIFDIMALLIWGELLPERCCEHKLSGTYDGITDCHIEGSWVMLYRKSVEKIVFYHTGTHSDLF